MPGQDTSKHLLFGILALHNGLIKREDFLAAVAEWLEDKSKPIDQVLLERKALSAKDHEWLKPAVERHIQDHQGNATLSLAAVESYDSVREQLENLEDPDVEEALADVDVTMASQEFDKYRTVGPTPSTRAESQLGSRFRILRAHRGGGLGFVSVAEDEELHREVALKQIRQKYADEDEYRKRFRVEAEITGGLEHPSIVPVYGLGQDAAGRPFYAMRFIRGDSLKDAIKNYYDSEELRRDAGQRRLRFREILRRFIDVCDAIHYAHSRGVLHRDLKPGNVMLGRYGETLVVDWGLAIPQGRDESTREESEEPTLVPVSASATTAETKGVPVGTPQYMAPEQATGRIDKMGPQTDVYALGATLYCILTGKPPFTGRDLGTTLSMVERGEFPRPRTLSSDVSKPLEAICVKAMATKISDRYATARELANDIERWLADEPVSAWPEPVHIRARRWIRNHQKLVSGVAAAAAVMLISAIVLTLVVNEWRRRETAAKEEALQNYQIARKAVDRFFTQVAEEGLLDQPAMEKQRESLLTDAETAYAEFVQRYGQEEGVRAEAARTTYRLGVIAELLGRSEDAVAKYKQALAEQQSLFDEDPSNLERLFDLSNTNNALGRAYNTAGNTEAEIYLTTALEQRRQLVSKAADTALLEQQKLTEEDVLSFQRRLANSLMNVGFIDIKKAEKSAEDRDTLLDTALGYLDESQQIRAEHGGSDTYKIQRDWALGLLNQVRIEIRRLGNDPNSAVAKQRGTRLATEAITKLNSLLQPADLEARYLLANAQLYLAKLNRNAKDDPAATEALSQGVGIARQLVGLSPDVAKYRVILAVFHIDLGDLAYNSADWAAAGENYASAFDLLDHVDRTKNRNAERDRAYVLRLLADLDNRAGNSEEATKKVDDALNAFRALVAADPDNTDYQTQLSKAQALRKLLAGED